MESDLHSFLLHSFDDALARGYIQPYYQPVIRTLTRRVCGFEALARWVDPERGMIRPDRFIGLLEEHRLIHRLDSYIIRQVCARLRDTMDRGERVVPVSFNLSRLDFELCDIFDTVDSTAAEFRIPRDCLRVEVTESMFADRPELIRAVTDRFRRAGYQVWMDDFGSGYSSLNMLKDCSFDALKVDMGFVSRMDLPSKKVLTSVIDMAKNLGLHTLVEGVETEELFQFLRDIGCEKAQGYLFGRPLPFRELREHLEQNGLALERPPLRSYYDSLGDVNVLSAAPFMSREQRDSLGSARELNSIPLALLELRGDHFTPLYCNAAFERILLNTQWKRVDLAEIPSGKQYPVSLLPERIRDMLDEARRYGQAELHFISGGEFYEAQAKCAADAPERYCLLFRLQNLSHDRNYRRASVLDAEMRHIYSLFDTMALIDVGQDRYDIIYMGPKDLEAPGTRAGEVVRAYAGDRIFPEDRECFLEFYDLDTLEGRILRSGRHYLENFFRTRNQAGRYTWAKYILVRCRAGVFLSLIRQAEEEIRVLRGRFPGADPAAEGALTPDRLWKSLTRSESVCLYWKDSQRRFVGATRGFLKLLGLSSPERILGRTDEEIGWHIRAEHAVNEDLRALRDGAAVTDRPLRFLVDGVNRNTLNSIQPVHDEYGGIVGLLESVREYVPAGDEAEPVPDFGRLDGLTRLLNPRGISEELSVYCDMYCLRGLDFVRIHLSIEDYDSTVLQYGRHHGEELIAALGRALGRAFGSSAALGRSRGHQFVLLRQCGGPQDIPALTAELRSFAASLGQADGITGSVYLSVGMCAFSECRDIFRQEQLADLRLEEDHGGHISDLSRQDFASSFFRIYDDLPIAFAVYEIRPAPKTGDIQASFVYVNARFAMEQHKTPAELIGRSLREVFPTLEREWYDIAYKAAFLSRETIVDDIYFDCMKTRYSLTASQVLRPGYCVFTYKPLDGPFSAGGTPQTQPLAAYQHMVDQVDRPCAIVSVDRADRGVRLLCANQFFKDLSPTRKPFRDGMYYHEHMPRNPKFEEFCYHAAIQGEAGHVYAESPNGWLDQIVIPLRSPDDAVGLCQFTFELTESAELRRMSTISVNVMKFAIRTGITLATTENFREGVQSVLEGALAISGAHHSRVFLMDHNSRTFQIYCDAADEYCLHKDTPFSYELLQSWSRCVGDRIAFLVTCQRDIDAIAEILPEWAEILRSCQVQSLVLLPLRRGREIFGYVDFVDFNTRKSAEVMDVAELITVFLAAEIANHQLMERLEQMSTSDALTGLRNRAAMLQRMDSMGPGSYGVVNLDLNGLKRVNDTMGHDAGDRLLVEAAEALKKVFYYEDIFRTGGDEFIVLLPGIGRESFDRKLSRFRAAMQKNEEVSFAIGTYWSDGSVSLAEGFRTADDAMYEDKKAYYRRNPDRRRQ